MRTLYLHVGHGKTGSSFIQSVCAKSRKALLDAGIFYPAHEDDEDAARGHISSGNGHCLSDPSKALSTCPDEAPAVLFSSEKLFSTLFEPTVWRRVTQYAKRNSLDKIEILLFIRAPIAHYSSTHQQLIKRRGHFGDFNDFISNYDTPFKVKDFIESSDTNNHIALTVKNYSLSHENLGNEFANWLGVDASCLDTKSIPTVNRSLTVEELYIQKTVNQRIGASGRMCADLLCNTLPDVQADEIVPPLETQDALIDRLEPAIAWVNSRVGTGNAYGTTRKTPTNQDVDTGRISTQQLDVVLNGLLDEIIRLRTNSKKQRSTIHRMRGTIKLSQGKIEDAEAAFRKALDDDDDNAAAALSLAEILGRDETLTDEFHALVARATLKLPDSRRLKKLVGIAEGKARRIDHSKAGR